jgi:hypothetical protein
VEGDVVVDPEPLAQSGNGSCNLEGVLAGTGPSSAKATGTVSLPVARRSSSITLPFTRKEMPCTPSRLARSKKLMLTIQSLRVTCISAGKVTRIPVSVGSTRIRSNRGSGAW